MKKVLSITLFILLSSCISQKNIEEGTRAASEGVLLTENGIALFNSLSLQAEIEKSQQDKLAVLTDPEPATMKLPDSKIKDFSKQLIPRIHAYQTLHQTYLAFSLLSDKNFSGRTKNAVNAFQNSYNTLDLIPDISNNVKTKLSDLSKILTQAIQAKKVKEHNHMLYELTSVYLTLWQEDQKTWNDYLDRVYDDYAKGLNSVETKMYDTKKIAEEFNVPYADENCIVMLYRLSERDKITKQKNDLKKQLVDFGNALENLNRIHAEISKQKTNMANVSSDLNSIEIFLKHK